MPFVPAYGTEVVVPTEVILLTLHLELADYHLKEIHKFLNLDLLEKKGK